MSGPAKHSVSIQLLSLSGETKASELFRAWITFEDKGADSPITSLKMTIYFTASCWNRQDDQTYGFMGLTHRKDADQLKTVSLPITQERFLRITNS